MSTAAADRPRGGLTTGAVGAIMAGVAMLLFYFLSKGVMMMALGGGPASRDEAESLGIMLLVELVVFGVGGILAMSGFSGLGKVFGSTNMVGGIFSLIMGIGGLLLIIAGFSRSMGIVQPAMYAIFGGLALSLVFGGIGQLATPGIGKVAGIISLVAGALWTYFFIGVFVPSILSPIIGIIDVVLIVMLLGGGVGFVLSGVNMLAARNAS